LAVRTTETAVRLVLQTRLTSAEVNAFIADASLFVDEELGTSAFSAARLELIEKYLSCALARLRELGVSRARFDDVWEEYQVDPQVTEYLKTAATYDTTGVVRRLFLPPKDQKVASFHVGQGFREEAEEADEA
jgi:hypothetical protein